MKAKEFLKTAWAKFKIFWRELGNVLTNILCPIMSILAAGAELLQLPTAAIQALKKAEYWCWYASGTKDKLDTLVEKVDGVVEKQETEEVKEIEDKKESD